MSGISSNIESMANEAFDSDHYDHEGPCRCDDEESVVPYIYHGDTYFDGDQIVSTVMCKECSEELGSVRFSITLTQE